MSHIVSSLAQHTRANFPQKRALLWAGGLAAGLGLVMVDVATAQQSDAPLGSFGAAPAPTAPAQQTPGAIPTPPPGTGGMFSSQPPAQGNGAVAAVPTPQTGLPNDGSPSQPPAQAQPQQQQATPVFRASQPDVIATFLQSQGYRALLERDSHDDPVIRSSANGVEFSIYFYGCTDGANCTTISFSSGFDLIDPTTTEVMNDWNSVNRFAYAYTDEEGDPYLNYDVTLEDGGLPPATFASSLSIWNEHLADFLDHINW